jgi:pimeloyl-ACP methyl ester carboxylesterase
MPYATNRGVRIHYEIEGDGPPIVLLHGGLGNLKDWCRVGYVDYLKGDYQLVLIDVRGHGASDKPHDPGAYELDILVNDIVAVLDNLHFRKSHFLGYSLGGRLGFGAAKYHPERFYSFIIGGAHPYMLDQKELEADLQLFKKGIGAVIASMEDSSESKMAPERRADLVANDLDAVAALFSASHWRGSLEDVLPGMVMPCLIFAGEDDPLYVGAKECVRSMPSARFISLPGLGHSEVLLKSKDLLPHITKFLASALRRAEKPFT